MSKPIETAEAQATRAPKEPMEYVGLHLSAKQVKTYAAFQEMRVKGAGAAIRRINPEILDKHYGRRKVA